MLTLYHTPGAVCAQKVRLGLEETGQPWQSEIVDLGDLEFMKRYQRDLNPNGVVPTLVAPAIERWGAAEFKRGNAAAVEQAWPSISALARTG